MEIAEQIYEWGTYSKSPIREDNNCDSNARKRKGGEAALPTIPKKRCAGKRKKNHAYHLRNHPNGEETCSLHEPGRSMKECKVLK